MKRKRSVTVLKDDPLWYKDAVIYEVHVRAFYDANGDGAGDFRGLTEKLEYLQDLGVTAIWLLPFCPSPWKDDGYDISDYTGVHASYGTMRDVHAFLREAHRRGIRVIGELVLNHTSDQHEWFQKSRRAKPGSRWRDFYVWTDDPKKYSGTRIIFKDFEASNWTWDSVAQAYYWHRFYSHQPDLNYDNPAVKRAVLKALDFWMDLGMDGLRLDAVPYLFEREGTDCENLPETHQVLKEVRKHIDGKYKNRMLLAEANQWPEDAVAYFGEGEGDECNMAFHFPLMPRLFMAVRMEDRYPIIDILNQTPAIPEKCQWATFLRNHDELTLEMVTDEERDYMYRVYAHDSQMRINLGIRRRLAPLLGNQRRLIELLNGLIFSLPGTPVIYYGDEIGMGDNIYLGDRDGVRTPMQWSADRNAGFSRASPQRLYLPITNDPEYHYETLNVEAQQRNPNSLLWWMKWLIAVRKQRLALSRGTIEFLHPNNSRVLAFVRRHEDERILVVANLSRFAQPVELDLSEFRNLAPFEMSGRVKFPPIGDLPYFITLGPHTFYWFSLEQPVEQAELTKVPPKETAPRISVDDWDAVLSDAGRAGLERVLPRMLKTKRWFRGKAQTIREVEVTSVAPLTGLDAWCLLVQVDYTEGESELYTIFATVGAGERADQIWDYSSDLVLARLIGPDGEERLLYEAQGSAEFRTGILKAIGKRRRFRTDSSELVLVPGKAFRRLAGPMDDTLESSAGKAEQSNSSIIYRDRLVLKLFRKLEQGVNPDLEISRYLTERARFEHTPPVAGWLEYRRPSGEPMTVGILQQYVPNQGDAWSHTLHGLGRFFETVLSRRRELGRPPEMPAHPLEAMGGELPAEAYALFGDYLGDARLLGQRTAEMHAALLRAPRDSGLAPEPFTEFYQQGLYHSMLGLKNRTMDLLKRRTSYLPKSVREQARRLAEVDREIQKRFRPLRDQAIEVTRISHHGDYHLGQVLWTGRDFVIIDFEGEPGRSLGERKLKRSALRDVAGMLRSYHYAPHAALSLGIVSMLAPGEDAPPLELWADFWYVCVASEFLKSYLETAQGAAFLPKTEEELRILLDAFLLEKAVYEVRYELNNRPDWVRVPIRGILSLLGETEETDPDG